MEFKEKWPVHLVNKILPRHMEIITYLNYFFSDKVSKEFPNDNNKLARMSIIETSNNN